MTKHYTKRALDVSQIRKYLEPGPIVLVSSKYKDETNIMTMGWHTVMEFSPSLFGCIISSANHSFDLIRKSKECVINIPTVDMLDTIINIGTHTGEEIDKFDAYGLTPQKAAKVKAPLIKECHTNIECKLVDTHLVSKYNFFIFKAVYARTAISPRYPKTVHYRGDGEFMIAGREIARKNKALL